MKRASIFHRSFFFPTRWLLLLPVVVVGYAQAQGDTVRTDTKRNRYLPTGIRLSTDLISLGKNYFQDDFNGWEVNADIDFDRYYLVFDYGTWGRDFLAEGSVYSNDGTYWRVGVDVNFLTDDPDRSIFFLGARFGRSVFGEQLTVMRVDSVWGNLDREFVNTDAVGRWGELTTGLRIKIWKFIWLGYTARFKFWLNTENTPTMLPHDVPGYGRTDRESYWGFNYQVLIRIPVRKDPRYANSR